MNRVLNRMGPPQILVLGFAVLILVGAVLLSLPVASASGTATNFLDALFTATSALCVTGLVVVDTASHWSMFGQIVILLLIQIGGLGIMTFAAFFALLLRKKIGLKERLLLQEALNKLSVSGVVKLVQQILLTTFIIESAGAVILTLRFIKDMPLAKAIKYGIFHSISAFNNAGFDLFGTVTGKFSSLTAYANDPVVSLTVAFLFIIGGLGFSVIVVLTQTRCKKDLNLHAKSVITTSLGLLAFGFTIISIIEWNNPATMGNLSVGSKLLSAFFSSATPRTAGFNTLDTAGLMIPTQFLLILLMFIGASPGSTGGGIKTTTFAAVFYSARATLLGKEEPTAFERRVPRETLDKALAVTFVAFIWVTFVTLILTVSEHADFLTTLFETTSAFGTVGLSLGLTTELSILGKIMITLTMFLGRLGPLTLVFAIAQRRRKCKIRYPEEQLMIG